MKNALMIAGATTLLVGCASTSMNHLNPFGSSGFKNADENGDGVVSRQEASQFPALAKNFSRIDTNRDQNINPKEYTAATTFLGKQPDFKSYDLNGDGFISKREADAGPRTVLHEVFTRIDADGDGNVSASELSAATINPLQDTSFAQLDIDNDGAISRKEGSKAPLLYEDFDRVDINNDGLISKEEYQQIKRR